MAVQKAVGDAAGLPKSEGLCRRVTQQGVGLCRGLLGAAEQHEASASTQFLAQLDEQVALADAAPTAKYDDTAQGLDLLMQLEQLGVVLPGSVDQDAFSDHRLPLGPSNAQVDRPRGRGIPAGCVAHSGPQVTSIDDAHSGPHSRLANRGQSGASAAIIDLFMTGP